MQALEERVAPEDRELRAVDDVVRDRDELLAIVLERAAEAEQEDTDPDRDPVEHDRRDHLVRADGRLQEPGDPRPERAAQGAGDGGEEDVEQRVHALERRADPDGEDRPHDVLALTADVEEPAAEGERDGETGEDQRRRDDQRLLHVERRGLRSSPVTHGKNQLKPAPSKIAR